MVVIVCKGLKIIVLYEHAYVPTWHLQPSLPLENFEGINKGGAWHT